MAGIDRRMALLGLTALPVVAGFRAQKGFFERKDAPIGVQLYTVSDAARADLDGSFAKLKAGGIEAIELAGYHGHSPQALRAAADKHGLRFTAIHIGAKGQGSEPGFDWTPERLAADMRVLGLERVVLPFFLFDHLGAPRAGEGFHDYVARISGAMTLDDWKRTSAFLNTCGAALKPVGLTMGYHNHNPEFVPVAGRTGLDVLLAETDPKLVTFELDAGWATAGGQNPMALLARYPGRFTMMHVKDVKPSTKTNFALQQDPTQVGDGKIDWRGLIPAAHAAGVRHFYIEQEPPFAMDRFDAVARSARYLRTLA